MDLLRQEVHHAIRRLGRRPAFTAIALLTLGLGIGANAAIYSVIRGVLLRPLPYGEPDRLALVMNTRAGETGSWLSEPEALEYREGVSSFEHFAVWSAGTANIGSGSGDAERVATASVSEGMFEVFGVEPAAGRYFAAEEWRRGGPPVVVLGHALWQRRFGGDRDIVGTDILVNNTARTVVGVLPAAVSVPLDYESTVPTELYMPLPLAADSLLGERGSHYLYGMARLRAGATIARANAELDLITRRWVTDGLVHAAAELGALAEPLRDAVVGNVRPLLLLVAGAVGFVLLIACANVANLLLARAEERRREVAVRASLGASRARIMAQLLTESGVLAVGGGALGLLIALAGVRGLVALDPASIPRIGDVHLDGAALVFTATVSLLAGVLFGLVPALQLSRPDLNTELREGGRSMSGGRARQRFRSGLVVAELALSVMLVIGAGLMIRTFAALRQIDLGFDQQSALTAELSLPLAGYEDAIRVERFFGELVDEVRQLPGVVSAAAGRLLPLTGEIGNWSITIEGQARRPEENPNGDWQIVTDGYFETMGMRLLSGRLFEPADRRGAPPVAVISRAMADTYWPGGRALGSRFRLGTDPNRPWITIVGVVEDVRHNAATETPRTEMYVPHAQWVEASTSGARRTMVLVARTAADPLALVPRIRELVRRRDADVPLSNVRTLDDIVAAEFSSTTFVMLLLAVFAGVALTLAAIGIYGVISYSVSQRTHEMGIRMALGATSSDVLRLVVGGGAALVGVGIAVGLGGSLAISRLMTSALYGVAPIDPLTFTIVPALLGSVALLACWVPSRRAAATPPVVALRSD
ncbi:MAG TPA: ABC transporter permease [Longimicrobiales bacterium]